MGTFQDFDSIIKNMGELPPSPVVATKLLELLRKENLKLTELANAVSLDPVVASRVLRMANSAYYAQQRQIDSVDRAIMVIGENTLKDLAMEYSLRSASTTYGVLERRLWENSVGCAVACRMIADRLTDVDKNEAYLAGLQHHIGKVLMINLDKPRYVDVMNAVDEGKGDLLDIENGLFAYSHNLVGAALLDHWNYPDHIIDVTHYHHDFETSLDSDLNREAFQISAIVDLAGAFCRIYGIGRARREEGLDLLANRGAMALSANPIVVDELLDKFQPNFIKERNLLLA